MHNTRDTRISSRIKLQRAATGPQLGLPCAFPSLPLCPQLQQALLLFVARVRLPCSSSLKGGNGLLPVAARLRARATLVLTIGRLPDLHHLAPQVDGLQHVVDGEHVRADADALEALAVQAVQLARVQLSDGDGVLLIA